MYINGRYFEDKRLLRLLRHLRELEKWVGKLEPPFDKKGAHGYMSPTFLSCPIVQWAPSRTPNKGKLFHVTADGFIFYTRDLFRLYTKKDSEWWRGLELVEKHAISVWLEEILTKKITPPVALKRFWEKEEKKR